MKQKKIKTTAKINYIYNATPQFVSIVDHGANQTPFTAVKMIHKGDSKMTIPRTPSKVIKEAKEALVQRMEFSKTIYKTEAEVVSYLSSNQWDGYTIESSNDIFVVNNGEHAKEAFTDLKKVAVENGVEAYVGSLAEVSDSVVVQAATDTASSVWSKVDYWGIWTSTSHELKGILEDGMTDGIAPGIDTITIAMEKVLSNILVSDNLTKAEKNTAIMELTTEYSLLVVKVSDLFDTLLNAAEPTDAVKAQIASLQKAITTIRVSDKPVDETSVKAASNEITDTEIAKTDTDPSVVADMVKELAALKEQVAEAVTKAAQAVEEVSVIKAAKPTLKSIRVDHVDDSKERKLSKQQEDELEKNRLFLRKCNGSLS